MRFLPVLTVLTVLVVAIVLLPNAVEAEAEAEAEAKPEAEAGADALPDAAPPANAERKKTKPKGTTTMSPKDLFLMHAQQSTTKKGSPTRKVAGSRATKATTTVTTATPTTTPAITTTTTPATTTVKAKGNPNAKPKAKGKGKGKGKACKTNQRGNRKSHAECQHSHHNKTVSAPLDVVNKETVAPAASDANSAAATPLESAVDDEATLDDVSMEMAASAPVADTASLDTQQTNATTTLLVNGTLKEVTTKADLIALDSVNGTTDERNVFP